MSPLWMTRDTRPLTPEERLELWRRERADIEELPPCDGERYRDAFIALHHHAFLSED